MTEDTLFNQRNEPCYMIQVAEVVRQIVAPELDFKDFFNKIYENIVEFLNWTS
ncbi:hypothetical protein BBOV_III007750 [Babesia bovis T2Bo]|uniref:Uncharacterized protein n=1 Tax=Babesia bovis TaxID=5865 RepID=A7AP51_BABBO|nr:hypothetical protein BBOV_III007750 [Babesia bovis T2Bo]EDO08335.1 hypothetical protein BBOV_III007750 [Babesia bovis T2Bo]|eukprot:XP_001611903.1 hypothetical protein [Babesia bovis T2Bo]